jgi:hypothetical protein
MTSVNKIARLAAVAVLMAAFVPSAKAVDDSDWPSLLTIQEPLQVSNLLLSPGTYILQRYSGVTRTVVMIYNVDNARWHGMVFGFPADRTGSADRSAFEIYRGAQGAPEELRFWYHRGWQDGIEFPVTSGSSSSTTRIQTSAPLETAYISK